MIYKSSSAATPEQINEVKRALKVLREREPEAEDYIQKIINIFPTLTVTDTNLILSNIYGYLSGHISPNNLPLICPTTDFNDAFNIKYI